MHRAVIIDKQRIAQVEAMRAEARAQQKADDERAANR